MIEATGWSHTASSSSGKVVYYNGNWSGLNSREARKAAATSIVLTLTFALVGVPHQQENMY